MFSICVWERKNRSEQVAPSSAEMAKPTSASRMPWLATLSARSRCPAPSARPIRALTPTAVPVASPIIRFWAGKAKDTAVSACSLTRLTNTLSTMLYRADTSMEAIIGRDMFHISLEMGMTPSLFSSCKGITLFCGNFCVFPIVPWTLAKRNPRNVLFPHIPGAIFG